MIENSFKENYNHQNIINSWIIINEILNDIAWETTLFLNIIRDSTKIKPKITYYNK